MMRDQLGATGGVVFLVCMAFSVAVTILWVVALIDCVKHDDRTYQASSTASSPHTTTISTGSSTATSPPGAVTQRRRRTASTSRLVGAVITK